MSSRRGTSKRSEPPPPSPPHPPLWKRVVWAGLLAGWAFVVASLLGFDPADAPSHVAWNPTGTVQNWCGPAGAALAYHTLRLLGWGMWMLLIGGGLWLGLTVAGRRIEHAGLRAVGIVLMGVGVAGFQALALPWAGPIPDLPGGLIGTVGTAELAARFSTLGTALWLVLLLLVGATVAFDKWVFIAPAWAWRRLVPAARVAGGGAGKAGGGLIGGLRSITSGRKPVSIRLNDIDEPVRAMVSSKSKRSAPPTTAHQEPDRRDKPRVVLSVKSGGKAEVEEAEDDELPGAPQVFDHDALKEKIAALPVRFAGTDRQLATDADLRDLQNDAVLEGYKFPGLDLLEAPEEDFNERLEELVRDQATALEAALNQYRIHGEVVGIQSGPVITLYDVKLAPGTKVSQIQAINSDIARALKAVNIRIVPNQVGRDTIGIEVPNPTMEKVRLRELMSNAEWFNSMKLPMFLGKDASGDPLIADLAKMPHMLIAGTTGSGKSVCMNTIITGFLYTKKPNELKLVLVDPKMVEMSQFKDIPHLMCPVVTEMGKAAAILEWAMGKMDERYELLAEAGVRDISGYNTLEWDELKERMGVETDEQAVRIPRRLPYMVFIIDELADLIMTNRDVEGSIVRLAQKARAVGIHLILATQRPQATVVTGLIKSNMPCRVCFKVASAMDSRIVMDQKGGELLLGQGDMLFLSPRTHKLQRAQGTLVDDKEIRRVVRFMRDEAAPSFERQLIQLGSADPDKRRIEDSINNSSASLAAAQEDPLFDRAVEIVLESSRGSVSLVQRRLQIGYTRASRLIDLMGIAGIIGEHKGSVAREVVITPDEWQEMKRIAGELEQAQGQQDLFPEPSSDAAASDPPSQPIAEDDAAINAEDDAVPDHELTVDEDIADEAIEDAELTDEETADDEIEQGDEVDGEEGDEEEEIEEDEEGGEVGGGGADELDDDEEWEYVEEEVEVEEDEWEGAEEPDEDEANV